jgi:RNA recognition motif-containing protein
MKDKSTESNGYSNLYTKDPNRLYSGDDDRLTNQKCQTWLVILACLELYFLSCRKLFVGGLTWETTRENLIEYFSQFGTIEDVIIKIDFNTGRSRGFGFVLFENKDAIDKIFSISEHSINGKSIDPKPAKHKGSSPIRKIFIGGLDPSVPEPEIRQYFGKYGKVIFCSKKNWENFPINWLLTDVDRRHRIPIR